MNIAQVIFEIGAGGAENVAVILSEQLIKKDQQVDLICVNIPNGNTKEKIEKNHLLEIGVRSFILDRKLGKFGFNSIFKLIRLINKEKYDIIHSHLLIPDIYVAAAKILCRHKFTHIITVHNSASYHPKYLLKTLFRQSIFVKCSPAIKKLNTIKEEYIVLNAVDLSIFSPTIKLQGPSLKEELKLPFSSKIIISVGNLRPQKNQIVGLRMIHHLIEQYNITNVHYVVCGHGSELSNLKNEIKNLKLDNNIHLLGSRDDIPRLLQQSDFFINFSKWEGLPLGVLEAFASGITTVISPIHEHRVIGDDMYECYYPKDFEAESFANVFHNLLNRNKTQSKTDIFKQRKKLMQEYSLNNFTNKYLEIYNNHLKL